MGNEKERAKDKALRARSLHTPRRPPLVEFLKSLDLERLDLTRDRDGGRD